MSRFPAILEEGRGRVIALVAGFGVAEAAATGLAAFATRDLFAALRDDTSAMPVAALVQLAIAGLLVTAARFCSRSAAEWLGQSFAISARRVLFRHLSRMEQRTIEARRAGAWGLRFVGDLGSLRAWVSRGLTDSIAAVIVLPAAALALWLLNPTLALHAFMPVGLFLVLMVVLLVFFEKIHRHIRSRRANIAIDMMERVGIAPQLDMIGRGNRELKRLDRAGEELRDSSTRRIVLRSALRSLPDMGAALGGVAVLWAAWRYGAPASEAAASLAVLGIIAVPLRGLAFVWDRRVAWSIAREKFTKVLDEPTRKRRRTKQDGPAGLCVDGLALHGLPLDLHLNAGDKIALSGPAAGGASSALRLLAGLDTPATGTVTFDTEDGKRPSTVLLCDDSPILFGSLRRNLTLGLRRKRPDDDAIDAAARATGLGPLIDRIGLNGKVGEGGSTLSRQERLALLLVRAKLARCQLLLVDLPEIALDADLTDAMWRIVQDSPATAIVVWPRAGVEKSPVPVHDLDGNDASRVMTMRASG